MSGGRAAAVDPGRGSLRLLIDPAFGPFFTGKLLSTAGIWVHNIASAIVVYGLTGSATLVGLVSVAQFAPQLFLTPLCGAMADRGDRRRQLVYGRFLSAAGSFGLVTWTLVVGLEGVPGALAVVVAALVVGIGFAIGGPAMEALLPSLVRPSELAAAVALASAPFTVARAAGPAIGALIVATAGPAAAFAVAGVGNLLFGIIVALIHIRASDRPPARDPSVRAGLRHIRADRVVLAIMVATVAVGFAVDPVVTLTPPVADALGGGEPLVGALASTFGIGAALAFPLLRRLRRTIGLPGMASSGLAIMAVGMAGLALSEVPWAALTAMGIGGVGMTLSVTALSTQVQQRVPDDLRGRVMAVWMVAFLGSRPFAAGMNGAIADVLTPAAALLTVAAIAFGAAWLVRPWRHV